MKRAFSVFLMALLVAGLWLPAQAEGPYYTEEQFLNAVSTGRTFSLEPVRGNKTVGEDIYTIVADSFACCCSRLKNPYSACLQECQFCYAVDEPDYCYVLMTFTAANGFGAEVAQSCFAIYNRRTGRTTTLHFDEVVNNPASVRDLNNMYAVIIELNFGSCTNARTNENRLSDREISSCMNEFYQAWEE